MASWGAARPGGWGLGCLGASFNAGWGLHDQAVGLKDSHTLDAQRGRRITLRSMTCSRSSFPFAFIYLCYYCRHLSGV